MNQCLEKEINVIPYRKESSILLLFNTFRLKMYNAVLPIIILYVRYIDEFTALLRSAGLGDTVLFPIIF